jgi:hypothetical protein
MIDKKLETLRDLILKMTPFPKDSSFYNCTFGILSGRIKKPTKPTPIEGCTCTSFNLDSVTGHTVKDFLASFKREFEDSLLDYPNITGYYFDRDGDLNYNYEIIPSREELDQYDKDITIYNECCDYFPLIKDKLKQLCAITDHLAAEAVRKAQYEELKKEFG